MWSGPASACRLSPFRSVGRSIDNRRLSLPVRRSVRYVLPKPVQFGADGSKVGHDVGMTHLQPIRVLDLTSQLQLSACNRGTQVTLRRLRHYQLLLQRTFAPERLRQLVAVIEGMFQRRRFRLAALPRPVRPNTVCIRPPLSWPTTFAGHRHNVIVTKRNDSCTQRVIVCERVPIASDERSLPGPSERSASVRRAVDVLRWCVRLDDRGGRSVGGVGHATACELPPPCAHGRRWVAPIGEAVRARYGLPTPRPDVHASRQALWAGRRPLALAAST